MIAIEKIFECRDAIKDGIVSFNKCQEEFGNKISYILGLDISGLECFKSYIKV